MPQLQKPTKHEQTNNRPKYFSTGIFENPVLVRFKHTTFNVPSVFFTNILSVQKTLKKQNLL